MKREAPEWGGDASRAWGRFTLHEVRFTRKSGRFGSDRIGTG